MAKVTSAGRAKGPVVSPAGKPELVKVKISLGRETARLLRLEAFGRDCSLGQVVEELVRSSPRRFVLVDRGVKGSVGSVESGAGSGPGLSSARGDVGGLGLVSEAG